MMSKNRAFPLNSKFELISLCLLFFLLSQSTVCAQNKWNQFRGPRGDGIAPSTTKLTDEFDLTNNVVWQTELPGIGWSSPVYEGNQIWVTTAITEKASTEEIQKKLESVQIPEIKTVAKSVQLRAICVDAELGAILHNVILADVENPDIINPMNSYASPTPAISNGNVVCHFGSYGTWSLDAQTGAVLWNRQFIVDHSVGPGSSPVIFEDGVLLVCDGMDKQFVACVDLETGKDIWIRERPPIRPTNPEFKKSYSTPLIIEIEGKHQAVIPAAEWIAAYDPKTGKELWRVNHGEGYSIAPMPTYESGVIVFSTGYSKPEFVAVDPTGSGDVTETHIRWRTKNAPAMPSFVGHQGKIYTVTENGILTCVDAISGEVVSRSRLGGNYSASPLLADGRLYFFSREGFATIFECNPEFKQIGRTNFENGIMASPAVYGNDLIVRTRNHMYRIQGRN